MVEKIVLLGFTIISWLYHREQLSVGQSVLVFLVFLWVWFFFGCSGHFRSDGADDCCWSFRLFNLIIATQSSTKFFFFPPIVSYAVCLAVKRIQTGADWMVAMRAGDVSGSWRHRGAIPPALGLSNLNEANRIDLRDSGTVERRGNRWNRSHRSVQFLQWSCFPTNAVLISPFCFTSTCWLKRSDDCNQWWWISSLCASFPDEICIRM